MSVSGEFQRARSDARATDDDDRDDAVRDDAEEGDDEGLPLTA